MKIIDLVVVLISNIIIQIYRFLIALNSADTKDTDIEVIRDILVDSLFSVLATLGTQCLLPL